LIWGEFEVDDVRKFMMDHSRELECFLLSQLLVDHKIRGLVAEFGYFRFSEKNIA
jgi:hypothetical protein